MSSPHACLSHVIDPTLLEPWQYILNVPGKNVRGKLIAAFNKWLKVDAEKVKVITEIVKMLHTASLLIDDIEDDSTLRRGVPVAHAIFGVPSTLNTANYVYVLALEKCHKLNEPKATQVFVQELLNLHRGQGQDILWRDTVKCPSEEQYKKMVIDKTGGLFRLAVGLMQVFSNDERDFRPLLDSLAYYFQVRDDYMNIASTEYFANKSFCEDLTEGKFSFPIIHAIKTMPHDNRLLRILKQRTRDITVKQHAVQFMDKCGSLKYTWKKLGELYEEILCLVQQLGGHESLLELISALHSQITPIVNLAAAKGVAPKDDAGRTGLLAEGGASKDANVSESTFSHSSSSKNIEQAMDGLPFTVPGIKVERLSDTLMPGILLPRTMSAGSDRSSSSMNAGSPEKEVFDTL